MTNDHKSEFEGQQYKSYNDPKIKLDQIDSVILCKMDQPIPYLIQ